MAATGIIYGATVAKALVLLDQAETATVRVPTSFDGRFIVLSVDAKKLRASVAATPQPIRSSKTVAFIRED